MEKYISQKTQKIVSALYLITDFIKDSDVIKWEIREEGIALVSSAMLFNTNYPIEREHATKLFLASSDKIISFLNIAQVSFLISKMNSSIVIHELESLVGFIKKDTSENHLPGYILSDTFFATDNLIESDKGQEDLLKTLDKTKTPETQAISKKPSSQENREKEIISLLKKDSNLTIKDFTRVIKGCSEKTIQRELISLVKKGVVKRIGERRWSTYSLK